MNWTAYRECFKLSNCFSSCWCSTWMELPPWMYPSLWIEWIVLL